ncbi:hypothetical protein [Martelella radicis]|uniref:DUF945 domain-containing protein n=1 Tax=Martelella radicis TaxID=1397476 RepID=A0A7W6KNC8_9HYPH|nr:hypothetical protein [Martelella radicis]MBB4124426.1 hypothetical protein [Martelella radicis]
MRKAPFRHFLLAGSFLAATTVPAFALDAEDMLSKLNAASMAQGSVGFTYDDVEEGDDGDITVSGVIYGPLAESPDAPVEIEQVAPVTLNFEGVKEDGNGGYTINKVSTFDLAFAADEFEFDIGSFTQEDIRVPADPDADMMSGMNYAGSTQATDITFTTNGHQVATIENASADQTIEAGTKASFLGTVSGIAIDLSGIDDMEDEARDTLTALDLMEMHAAVTLSGDWDMQSGDMNFSTYEIAVEDVGTLNISFGMTGLTLETMETFQKLAEEGQKAQEMDSAEAGDEQNPSQQYLLELGQKIGLSELRVSFTDDSITTRALQYAAEKEGMIAEEMADKIEVDLGASLSAMNVPGLADMVTTAVGTYFSDPQNISVSIKPQMQMPILAVVMAGAAAPQSIPQLLNLQVTANE